jgi:hypothetical protein
MGRILALFIAFVVVIIGLRMIGAALYTAFTGKVLVRKGVHTKWVTAPNRDDTWGIVFRDGLMGVLLIVLGMALLT